MVRTKKPWVRFRGRGVGSSCVLYAKKRVSYVRENRVPNTRKNCFWRINVTRNDIRAIDIRTFMRSGWLCHVCVCVWAVRGETIPLETQT